MKRMILVLGVVYVTLLSAAVWAAPVSTFTATHPTLYENSTVIPASDVLSFTVYCGNATGTFLWSYDVASLESGTQIDISTCVQGTAGTYYFVATATSLDFGTESVFSNETTRVYTANDLGQTPLAPTFLTVS